MAAIKVSQPVLDGIWAVRDSGETNMFDYQQVMRIASKLGFHEAVVWLNGHKSEYAKGIFSGFEAE